MPPAARRTPRPYRVTYRTLGHGRATREFETLDTARDFALTVYRDPSRRISAVSHIDIWPDVIRPRARRRGA